MNRAKILVIGAMLLAASPVLAQDATPPAGGAAPAAPAAAPEAGPAKKMVVGVDVLGVLPLGDYSNASSFALGAAGRFGYMVNPKLTVTARVGYLYHFGTPSFMGTSESLYIIPVHVGAEYELAPKILGWAELGLDHIAVSVGSLSNSDDKFGFAVGAGYRVMPKLTLKAGFYMPGSSSNSMGGSTTFYGILFSAGYDIAAF